MTEEQAIKVLGMIETHGGLAFKAKEIAIKDIKGMEEIKEIIECDADAETKCKMISYILTAKPHYFEEQKSCNDTINRQAVNVLVDELARAISDERCCISRGRSTATIMQDILDLPPAKPQERTGYWIKYGKLYQCSECEELSCCQGKFCNECGAKMVEPQEGSK